MKFYVDEEWVYYTKTVTRNDEEVTCLHKARLDSYGFFNTKSGIPIFDLNNEAKNMNDYNNLKRLEDLLLPKVDINLF
jgi:hypothetical protein